MASARLLPDRGDGPRVLVVEDDKELLSALERYLREEGFSVALACDGEEALSRLLEVGPPGEPIDVVVLDLLLPRLNGREVCYRLRTSGCWVPVLMATAFGEVEDRIQGFADGADDYLVKPFSLAELVVRLRAILRRGPTRESGRLEVGDLMMDIAAQRTWRGGSEIPLSRREFAVLQTLMHRPGIVLSRQAIVAAVWGSDAPVSTNLLEQYIARLRKKIDAPFGRDDIETLPRVGYRLRIAR